jgi:two-component system, OmpR family, phosphate regulon sensor histidine kinase PhoR
MVWVIAIALASAGLAVYLVVENRRLKAALASAKNQAVDISEARQRAEQERSSLQAEYDALLDRAGSGVVLLDDRGSILSANSTARRLLGSPFQVLEGRSLLQATLSEELDGLIRSVKENGSEQQREVRMPGAASSLAVTVSSVQEENGRTRYMLIANDVTELRRLEAVRRDFVANVSHELRTPLASIRALAETLEDGALSDPTVASRFLGTIVGETQRLTRIAEDLLILTDAESHAPEKTSFKLSGLIEEVVNRSRPQAERAGIQLTAEVEPDVHVVANPDQLEQVMVNLVDNAIKYTAEGGTVHVASERMNGKIAVRVADTGIGIMSQDLPRIFERFYRVDKARSRKSGGTGLGLSIVKHIVESHGGQVTVVSEHNRGSTFTFTLPAQDA